MKRTTGKLSASIALLFCVVGIVRAQDTLSLAQAIAIGLKNNFEVQIALLNSETAKRNNTWGSAGALPILSLDFNQYNDITQRKPATPFAVPGTNVANGLNGRFNTRFVLFGGWRVHIEKNRLEQLQQASLGNAMFVMENTLADIIMAYYRVLVEKERLGVFTANMRLSQTRYRYAELRREVGERIQLDVLQAQSDYLTDSANVLEQRIVYKRSKGALALLLSRDADLTYALSDSLAYQQEAYAFETLYDNMMTSNTRLKNRYIDQEIARHNTRLQRADQKPEVMLNLGASGSLDWLNAEFNTLTGRTTESLVGNVNRDPNNPVYQTREEIGLLRQTQAGNSYGAYGNIGVRFTLFDGSRIKRAIQEAQAQEKAAALQTEQLKKSLYNDLLAHYDTYILKGQMVALAKAKLEAAQLSFELADARYQNGTLSAIDLRIVQEKARNVALEYHQAVFEGLASRIALMRLTGGLMSEQVDED